MVTGFILAGQPLSLKIYLCLLPVAWLIKVLCIIQWGFKGKDYVQFLGLTTIILKFFDILFEMPFFLHK